MLLTWTFSKRVSVTCHELLKQDNLDQLFRYNWRVSNPNISRLYSVLIQFEMNFEVISNTVIFFSPRVLGVIFPCAQFTSGRHSRCPSYYHSDCCSHVAHPHCGSLLYCCRSCRQCQERWQEVTWTRPEGLIWPFITLIPIYLCLVQLFHLLLHENTLPSNLLSRSRHPQHPGDPLEKYHTHLKHKLLNF